MIRSSRSARCLWGRPTRKYHGTKTTKNSCFFGPLDFFLGSFNSFNATLFGGKQILDANIEVVIFLREFAFRIRGILFGLVIFRPDFFLGIFPIQKWKKNLQDVTSMVGFDNAKVVSARSVASTLAFWVDG